MRRVVVVGASLAGLKAAEAIREEGFDGTIELIGSERHPPYQRPPLSKQVLAGKWGRERADLKMNPDLGLDLRLGCTATALDLGRRRVTLDDGDQTEFDGLVIATGAEPRRLPAIGDSEGVHYLRTLDDCDELRKALEGQPRVVVIGAGFIGSEVAATARGLGLDVTLLEALPVPLAKALGEEMGAFTVDVHRDNGVDVRLNAKVEGIAGDGRVEAVRLEGGEVVPADVVVVGVGVAPVTGWLEGSGLTIDNGVVCDETCAAVGAENVYAAGDVARWRHPLYDADLRFEHWDNATAQGRTAGRNLVKGPDEAVPFDHVPFFWSDQYDMKLQFIGYTGPGDEVRVVEGSVDERRFVAAYGRHGRVVGALLVNRPPRMPTYQKLVAERAPMPEAKSGES